MEKNIHTFVFTPGIWVGQGRIVFSTSPTVITYYTKWTVDPIDEKGRIHLRQQVEMQGVEECVFNDFTFYKTENGLYEVLLENEMIGKTIGKVSVSDHSIGWEYRGEKDFEGFEICQLLESGDYQIHAEYFSSDNYRTTIDGRIWKKAT